MPGRDQTRESSPSTRDGRPGEALRREFRERAASLTDGERAAASEAMARRDREAVEAAVRAARERAVVRSGVPGSYRSCHSPGRAGELLAGLMSGEVWCAYLWGDVGRGKTDLACGVVTRAVEAGVRARFVGDSEMLGEIRSAADDPLDSQEAALARLVRCPLLAIDDLGKTRLTRWGVEQLWRVVDGRYRERRPTVVTTNLDRPRLAAWLAQEAPDAARPIASRLSEGVMVVHVEGPDWRLAR